MALAHGVETVTSKTSARRDLDLGLIVESIPIPVAVTTPTGEVDVINQPTLDYFGRTLEELIAWKTSDIVHPDDLQDAVAAQWAALDAGRSYSIESRHRRADGVYRWFNVLGLPLRDRHDRILCWFHLQIDIDDRKRAEEALQANEVELWRRAAFLREGEAVSETGTFLWRLETNDISWSDQLYRIFEFEPNTLVTLERITKRFHPEDVPLMEEMVHRAQVGHDLEYDKRLLMDDGSVKYVHVVAHARRDQAGGLEYIGAVQNVTARRLSERALSKVRSELAHLARVASLSAVTASVAHEVNQPLSGIITNASTCLRMLGADPPNLDGARATAQRTLRDANRASEVIRRLRAMFAKREPVTERFDLNEAAREVLALSSSELQRSRVIVWTDFHEGLPAITGDRVQLQQVLLNLILNAVDAMRTVEDRPRNLSIATAYEDGNRVRLSVRDSGVGIDPQNREKLFDAFYTTKSDGMGVGLSVSRSIIEGHEGRLWATANEGPGATFSFSIPCRSEPAPMTMSSMG